MYMSKTITWKRAAEITKDPEKNVHLFKELQRKPSIKMAYKKSGKDVKDNYVGIRDFLLIHKFDCDYKILKNGKK